MNRILMSMHVQGKLRSTSQTAHGEEFQMKDSHIQFSKRRGVVMQPTFGNVNILNVQHALLDSFIVPGFLQTTLGKDPSALFVNLHDTAPWTDPSDVNFKYRGNELARKKATLLESPDPVPLFDQEPSVMPSYGMLIFYCVRLTH